MEIKEIYKEYFNIIDDYFGSIKHYLGAEEDSHIDLGQKIASYPLISDLIIDAINDLDDVIEKYWTINLGQIVDYAKKQQVLKCLYSGDITPIILEKFVKKSALYVDTAILPDPIFNLALYQRQIVSENKYYLNKLIRHVFNIWKLKDILLANTKERIILILPISLDIINEADRNYLIRKGDERFVSYINLLFDENFTDKESGLEHLRQYKTALEIYNNIKRLDILPNKFKILGELEKFTKDFYSTAKYARASIESIGESFGLYLFSNFIRVQEHQYFCQKLIAEPIYDYELPWFFFNYENGGLDMDATIANALQREKFDWISRVPLPALKILREENKLESMRGVIRRGITDLKAKSDSNLLEVSRQIEKNLKEEFKRQRNEISSLQKEVKKIVQKDVPITTGGFLAGFIPYLGKAISLLAAGRDIHRLIKEYKRNKSAMHEKETDFINLLMRSYDRR